MGNKLEHSEIMSNVLEALDISANKLATRIGYKSTSSIYNVMDDTSPAKITLEMAEAIVEQYPKVNFLYLTRGEDPILLERGPAIGQSNFFDHDKPSYDDVPGTLVDIKNLLSEVLDHLKK